MENPVLPYSCVTPAGTSTEVQNEWEENTHTHTHPVMCNLINTHIHPIKAGNQNKQCLKKNQNTPRPSEHSPVMGEKMSKRLGGIKGCKYKTSSWHLNRFPDADNIGSTLPVDPGSSVGTS